MAWRGSLSRTLISTARSSISRPSPPLPRLRPPSLASPRLRHSFTNPRNLGEIGCSQLLLPMLAGTRLTSHLNANVRAFCELTHGT
ncbi:uncharacterized protein LOC108213234 isoform X2 [Daucus carota subsp. sativus]|nr:PREDICTED: uncharacterized protein LOC108213234 isoform X2 [Daucus carota subsp. sativus]